MKKKPELLAGIGDFASAVAAVKNGADAVYFGVKGFNMRDLGTNFYSDELKKLMGFLHERKAKGYLALNTIVFDEELKKAEAILKKAKNAKVDAVILSDMAVLDMAKKLGLTPFLSTQASVSNKLALNAYKRMGVRRAILARELNLKQIAALKKSVPGIEIECFVHGAMCISVSGRCFLSHELFGTSANRGKCLQPCRRAFFLDGKAPDFSKKEILLQGHTIISPKDLKAIGFLDKVIASGIDSMKIEGRNKPAHYIATVTSCYRKAIDSVFDKTFSKPKVIKWNKELARVFNRGFSSGFFFSMPGKTDLAKQQGSIQKQRRKHVGVVLNFLPKAMVAEIKLFEPLSQGTSVLIEGSTTYLEQTASSLQVNHKQVSRVSKGKKLGLKVEDKVRKNDKVFILIK